MNLPEKHRWMTPPKALYKAILRFNDNHGWILSSHVAMSLMLALFPFMLFVVALAGAMSRDVNIDDLIQLIFGVWPDDIAAPIVAEIRSVLAGGSVGLVTVGGILALYFASNGVDAVRLAVSYAYRESDPRPYWKTRGLCLIFVLVGGAIVLVGLTVSFGLPAYFRFVAQELPDPIADLASYATLKSLITLGVLIFSVSACHIWLPGLHHRFREIWPGVLLTVGLWYAATWGFSIYLAHFARYSATYAGLAGAMAALIFLYLIAAILILGAEFNGALIRRRNGRKMSRPFSPLP